VAPAAPGLPAVQGKPSTVVARDLERVQLKAQFSQALAAGIHTDTHNSPQDPDPVGQLATAHERQGEQDLAG